MSQDKESSPVARILVLAAMILVFINSAELIVKVLAIIIGSVALFLLLLGK